MNCYPTKSRLSLLAALVAGLFLTGCGSKPKRPNVLWIVVDTMRADRLGGERNLTPYMDRLAARGARFDHAYSQAPWTLPSIASMMTSLHPKEHGAGGRLGQFTAVRKEVPTAPATFARAGYQTHAIVNVEFLKTTYGVTRDFQSVDVESYNNNVEVRNATRTTDTALDYMRGAEKDKPFFLLLHYFDIHAVYDPPQPFRERYAAPPDKADGPDRTLFGTREHMMALRAGKLSLTPDWVQRASMLYDGEVAYTDSQIGRLMDGLRELGLEDDTIVVLCGDHGEEFLDHGGFEHGHTVYDELIHVPLVMAGPGIAGGKVVEPTVRMIDVLPTLCEWADVGPERTFVGHSLMPMLQGTGGASRPVLSHGNMWGEPHTAWRSGDWKLIVAGDGHRELFDMRADPKELENRAAGEVPRADEMAQRLHELEDAMARLGSGAAVQLTEAERERLRSFGYGGGKD
ncbi:MAG: sulfatase [Planctomycetota bacterium]